MRQAQGKQALGKQWCESNHYRCCLLNLAKR